MLELTNHDTNIEQYVFYDQITKSDAEVGVIEGSMNIKKIPAFEIDSKTQFYICGPAGFIKKQYQDLVEIGADPATVFFEEFGPQQLSLN